MAPHWPGDDEGKPAPGSLRCVQELVNTVERPDGADRLADPADARPWLLGHGLLGASADLTPSDLTLVAQAREALRAMLVHNGGGSVPAPGTLAPLVRIAAAARIRPTVSADGSVGMTVDGDDVVSRLAGLLITVRDAQRDGTWWRLKACRSDECRWAFYDTSRNRGGAWCDMGACGNKVKNREFRARKRAAKTVRTDARPAPPPAHRAR